MEMIVTPSFEVTKAEAVMLLELLTKAVAGGPDAKTLASLYEKATQALAFYKESQQ